MILNIRRIILLTLAFILLFIIVLMYRYQKDRTEIHIRESLARELGLLDVKNYSRDANFPADYFYDVLLPGMPIDQVHETIKGYTAVYTCQSVELYYFYSSSLEEAVRISLIYDLNKDYHERKLVRVNTEEKNSRTLNYIGCIPGIEEQ